MFGDVDATNIRYLIYWEVITHIQEPLILPNPSRDIPSGTGGRPATNQSTNRQLLHSISSGCMQFSALEKNNASKSLGSNEIVFGIFTFIYHQFI